MKLVRNHIRTYSVSEQDDALWNVIKSHHLVKMKPEKFLYPSILLPAVLPHTTHLPTYLPHLCIHLHFFSIYFASLSCEENSNMQISHSLVTPTQKCKWLFPKTKQQYICIYVILFCQMLECHHNSCGTPLNPQTGRKKFALTLFHDMLIWCISL